MTKKKRSSRLALRPYQLLCSVCALGRRSSSARDRASRHILAAVKADPDVPVILRCNAGGLFSFQDPGTKDDTPKGADFNIKRDIELLRRMDIVPGSTLPARTLYLRLLDRVPTVTGICSFDTVFSEAWKRCSLAGKGHYEKGRARGISAIIPARKAQEMTRAERLRRALQRAEGPQYPADTGTDLRDHHEGDGHAEAHPREGPLLRQRPGQPRSPRSLGVVERLRPPQSGPEVEVPKVCKGKEAPPCGTREARRVN